MMVRVDDVARWTLASHIRFDIDYSLFVLLLYVLGISTVKICI
jgi:hypothetical protein